MAEERFHEIQLNGKQLVFLFMAATVVSVVIFLCGVLVGRGVRNVQVDSAAPAPAAGGTAPSVSRPVEPAPAASAPGGPPPAAGDLSYYDRLQRNSAPTESLKPAESGRASPPAVSPPPVEETPPPTSTEPAAESSGSGFAVQVAALRERREADAIVQRLIGEGYPAYVLAPTKDSPAAVYRVRVGQFKNRREAEQAASRLEKEKQFKPWIVR